MGERRPGKPLQKHLTEPQLANSIRSHTVKPPSADRLTECDILLQAGGGYTARVSAPIFPIEWYPRPEPEYIIRWRNLAAQRRGTRVSVDIQGRPMVTTVKRTKAFIDVSRAARAGRSLGRLRGLLAVLVEESADSTEQLRRSRCLSQLDQGLGDLIRVVQFGRVSEGGGNRSRPRSRRGVREGASGPSSSRS